MITLKKKREASVVGRNAAQRISRYAVAKVGVRIVWARETPRVVDKPGVVWCLRDLRERGVEIHAELQHR